MSVVHIKSGKTLGTFLSAVINESMKSALQARALQEKETQDATAAATSGQAELPDDERQALESGDVSVDAVIEKMNTIRSGRSFKDENVKKSMEDYVGSLDKAEKAALFAFLKAISQIVVGELPAQQAVDPSKKPTDVEMKKGAAVQKRSIKPNVIRAKIPEKAEEPAEDTEAPVPITPKK